MNGVRPQSGRDGAGEPFRIESSRDFLAGRKMERRSHVPGRRLGEAFRQMRQPETSVAVARTVANDEQAAGSDARREPRKKARLLVRAKVMQKIEKHDVASLCNRIADILFDEIEIIINALLHRVGALDFAAVTVKAADRREKVSLAQIESQQANPAADIEERLARFSKQLESRRKNWIAAQFSPGIHAQPAFTKTRRHPRAGIFVRARSRSIFLCVALVH